MNIDQFISHDGENPLDRIIDDGGFCSVFRTIGVIGDSLSSGEFESMTKDGTKGYHDYFEYSWGQYIARAAGITVFNYSRGGMTAKRFYESFAREMNFWEPEKVCQAYIIALGVNDMNHKMEMGSSKDIHPDNYEENTDTLAGWLGRIISRIKKMQPQARFFLVTRPRETKEGNEEKVNAHVKLMYELADVFDYTYVIDLAKYGPLYDEDFKRRFYLGGHMNPAGYILTAKMIMSYIDFIIRNSPEDFAQIGFIGKPFHNEKAKW